MVGVCGDEMTNKEARGECSRKGYHKSGKLGRTKQKNGKGKEKVEVGVARE